VPSHDGRATTASVAPTLLGPAPLFTAVL